MINAITTTIGNRYVTAYWPVAAGAFRKKIANDNQDWAGQHVRAAQALLNYAAEDFSGGKYIIVASGLLGNDTVRKAVHTVEWQND